MGTPTSPAATPSFAGRGKLPKVPSLLFDMEMEDGTKAVHSSDEMDLQLVEAELRRFLRPCSLPVAQLAQQVEAAAPVGAAPAEALDAIDKALQRTGHRVRVRKALGGGEGSLCLHNLRHTFLDVSCPGVSQPVVVDPAFSEQFRIAKPTPRYESILTCLPAVLVLPEDRVSPLVTFLCAELAAAFRASNAVVPPWRQASSMLSKWQPRHSLDLPSGQQQAQHKAGVDVANAGRNSVHPQGSRSGAGKMAVSAAVHIKPMVSEPSYRVYGGFGASFGGTFINMAT